jgi:hypothetical protein
VTRTADDNGPFDVDEYLSKALSIEPSEQFLPTVRRRLSVEPRVNGDALQHWFVILALLAATVGVIALVGGRRQDFAQTPITLKGIPPGADIVLMAESPNVPLAPHPTLPQGLPKDEPSAVAGDEGTTEFDRVVASLTDPRIKIVFDEPLSQVSDDGTLMIPPIQIEPLVTP